MSKDDPFYNKEYIKIPATYRIDVGKYLTVNKALNFLKAVLY